MTHLHFDTPLLSADDERQLSRTIEAGVLALAALNGGRSPGEATAAELHALVLAGQAAHSRFVSANLRLVALVIGPLARAGRPDPDDLFQEGVVGLIEAVRRFDHRRGVRFATFAIPSIRTRVQDAVATRCGEAGLPVSRARRWVQVRAERDRLAAELGREPSDQEVADRCGWRTQQVRELLSYVPAARVAAVELLAEQVPVPDGATDAFPVRRLLRRLSAEERGIVTRLFGLGPDGAATHAEIARDLGMSVSTVRRREQAALERLRAEHAVQEAA